METYKTETHSTKANLTLETKLATMWLDEDGILYAESKNPNAPRTPEEIAETKTFLESAAKEGKIYMLVNAVNGGLPDKRSRSISAENLNKHLAALAIISKSKTTNMMAKIFLTAFPPSYRVKLFSEKDKAQIWLKEQITSR